MSRMLENTGFVCEHCFAVVSPLRNGSFRNHCPFCLHSKHLDNKPGDRQSQCQGLMQPIGIRQHKKKGLQIIHRCMTCGHTQANKSADDVQGDDINVIIHLASM